MADRLRGGGHARRRNGAGMAGARGQARPQVRAGSRRRLLPHPVSFRRLVLLTLPMIGGRLGLLLGCRCAAAAKVPVAECGIVKVVSAFILTAVAAHDVVS